MTPDTDPQSAPARDAARFTALAFLQAPLIYTILLKASPLIGAVAAALVVCVALARAPLAARFPRTVRFASAAYFAGVIGSLALLGYLAYLATTFWLIPAIALAAAAIVASPRPRVARIAIALAAAGSIGQAATIDIGATALFAIPWLILAAWIAHPRVQPASRVALATAVLGGLLTARLLAFYAGTPLGEAARVDDQPGVRIVAAPRDLGDSGWFGLHHSQIRFVQADCSGSDLWIGTRQAGGGLYYLTVGTDAFSLIDGDVSDNALLDCASDTAYFGDYAAGAVRAMRPANGSVRTLPVPGQPIAFLARPRPGGTLFAMGDGTPNVIAIDPESMTGTARKPLNQPGGMMIADPARNRVVRSSTKGRITALDADSMEIVAERDLPEKTTFYLERGPAGSLYAASMVSGMLRILNGETFDVRGERFIERGIRFLRADPDRGALYVSGFFSGNLICLDAETFAERGRVRVGPRPRWLELSEDGRFLYVGTGVGGVQADLDEAFDAPTAPAG